MTLMVIAVYSKPFRSYCFIGLMKVTDMHNGKETIKQNIRRFANTV
jgi:hypothetical protein